MLHQKVGLTSPACRAPGISSTTALSTTSMVRIEIVSASTTVFRAIPTARPLRSSGRLDSAKPKAKARASANGMLARAPRPIAVATTRATISPVAHPVRQCRVALAAMPSMPCESSVPSEP